MLKILFRRAAFSSLNILILILAACNGVFVATPTPSATQIPTPTLLPEAMVTFRVQLPAPLSSGETVLLTILDEVTGLALNPESHPMQAEDSTHYTVILHFPVNAVVKYRYTRQGGGQVQEHISDGRAVRYRLYHVDGPGTVQDVIGRWTDTSFIGPTGRISGTIVDEGGAPLPGILVSAGGAQTFTDANGNYLLEGLPPGTHNLVAYALDGAYRIYQQGAVVAAESTTPARLRLLRAPLVKVTFLLIVPAGTYPAIPIRLAGNLYQVGNTFGDLTGGISASVTRMPVLSPLPDGRYSITLDLPEGADLRYKYTLGDGLWNAEHDSQGKFAFRQLIISGNNTQIHDQVQSWHSGSSAPITFQVSVPATMPAGDFVSIQFNPAFGWTEPVPMWPIGDQRWMYVLYSPLETIGEIGYRYCRDGLCGSADDGQTSGPDAPGRSVHTSVLPETIVDQVDAWAWLSEEAQQPITLPNTAVRPRGTGYVAGVELQPYFHPSWRPLIASATGDIAGLKANWLFLTPTWTFTRQNLPVLEPVAGWDPLWPDSIETIVQARSQGLQVALFPTPRFPGGASAWWKSGTRDFPWWTVWFERYGNFLLHHAELAAHQNAAALVLGGEWLSPALPGGTLSDGSASNVPADAEARWRKLLGEMRSRFKGSLIWALPYPQGLQNPPPFLDSVDIIYLLWSAPITPKGDPSEIGLAAEAGRLLDKDVMPLQGQIKKSIVIGLAYPSAKGATAGCLPSPQGGCLDLDALARPSPDIPKIELDLQEQVRAYSAMFLAVNERDWISGLVSRGYYPPAILQDKSSSIHGKPAAGVLWYWFPRLLESEQ